MPRHFVRPLSSAPALPLDQGVVTLQGSRIRVCGPMLGVVTETSGLPDPLTEPAKDETSVQTAGLF